MKKRNWITALVLALTLLFTTTAFAFEDLPTGSDRDKIRSLQERGIVNGYGNMFMGNKKMTNAEGIHLIVKGTELSLAAFLFIKEPLATDSFDKVPNNAWYAQSFVIAAVNGLELPRDLDPNAEMTREAFAHHLMTAINKTGTYAFTKRYFVVTDEEEMNPDYRYSLQLLLNGGILQLGEDGKFYPKKAITRREAAIMIHDAVEFIKARQQPVPDEGITVEDPATMEITKVNDEINKVTLTWGEKPNSGYALSITRIEFHEDKTATIFYKQHLPQPDHMYAQVITTPEVSTYVASEYTPVLELDR